MMTAVNSEVCCMVLYYVDPKIIRTCSIETSNNTSKCQNVKYGNFKIHNI